MYLPVDLVMFRSANFLVLREEVVVGRGMGTVSTNSRNHGLPHGGESHIAHGIRHSTYRKRLLLKRYQDPLDKGELGAGFSRCEPHPVHRLKIRMYRIYCTQSVFDTAYQSQNWHVG